MTRKDLEKLYCGFCTITVEEPVTNPETGRVELKERVLVRDEPCRLTYYYYLRHAAPMERETEAYQRCALFVRRDLEVPVGSKISVQQHGFRECYERAGLPVIYSAHREIPLMVRRKA
ncbi:MAG: hypothetical protein RSC76_05360 [Oscillospiraceae bacterium]